MPHRHIRKIHFIEIKTGHSAVVLPAVVRRAEGTDRCVEEEDLRGRSTEGFSLGPKAKKRVRKPDFTEETKADVERCNMLPNDVQKQAASRVT